MLLNVGLWAGVPPQSPNGVSRFVEPTPPPRPPSQELPAPTPRSELNAYQRRVLKNLRSLPGLVGMAPSEVRARYRGAFGAIPTEIS